MAALMSCTSPSVFCCISCNFAFGDRSVTLFMDHGTMSRLMFGLAVWYCILSLSLALHRNVLPSLVLHCVALLGTGLDAFPGVPCYPSGLPPSSCDSVGLAFFRGAVPHDESASPCLAPLRCPQYLPHGHSQRPGAQVGADQLPRTPLNGNCRHVDHCSLSGRGCVERPGSSYRGSLTVGGRGRRTAAFVGGRSVPAAAPCQTRSGGAGCVRDFRIRGRGPHG